MIHHEQVRNHCDVAASNRFEITTGLHLRFLTFDLSATKFAPACCDKSRICKLALRLRCTSKVVLWITFYVLPTGQPELPVGDLQRTSPQIILQRHASHKQTEKHP